MVYQASEDQWDSSAHILAAKQHEPGFPKCKTEQRQASTRQKVQCCQVSFEVVTDDADKSLPALACLIVHTIDNGMHKT